MLVLSRKLDEQIIIGEDIVVTVVQIEYGKVRLGIDAPAEVEVDRMEFRARKRMLREGTPPTARRVPPPGSGMAGRIRGRRVGR